MSETTAFLLIIVLDLAAVAGLALATAKFVRGAIVGAIAGLVIEVLRIISAMAITGSAGAVHSDTFGWLVNLRVYNIPILIGLGFMAGSAAAQQAKLHIGLCPACGKKLTFDPQVLQTKADPARKVCLPCPACAASLVVDADTCEVTQALPGTDTRARSSNA